MVRLKLVGISIYPYTFTEVHDKSSASQSSRIRQYFGDKRSQPNLSTGQRGNQKSSIEVSKIWLRSESKVEKLKNHAIFLQQARPYHLNMAISTLFPLITLCNLQFSEKLLNGDGMHMGVFCLRIFLECENLCSLNFLECGNLSLNFLGLLMYSKA